MSYYTKLKFIYFVVKINPIQIEFIGLDLGLIYYPRVKKFEPWQRDVTGIPQLVLNFLGSRFCFCIGMIMFNINKRVFVITT